MRATRNRCPFLALVVLYDQKMQLGIWRFIGGQNVFLEFQNLGLEYLQKYAGECFRVIRFRYMCNFSMPAMESLYASAQHSLSGAPYHTWASCSFNHAANFANALLA